MNLVNGWETLERIEVNNENGYEVIGPYHEWLRVRGVQDPAGHGGEKTALFTKAHFRFWGGSETAKRDSQAPEIAGYRYHPERQYRILWLGERNLFQKSEVFVRLQSMCFNGIVEGAVTCDCGDQFDLSKKIIVENWEQKKIPGMMILADHHEGKGLGPRNHALIDAMSEEVAIRRGQEPDPSMIDRWMEPFIAISGKPQWDELEDQIEIMKHFGLKEVILIASTNNPRKIRRLEQEGFKATRVPMTVEVDRYNRFELMLKQNAGHLLDLKKEGE